MHTISLRQVGKLRYGCTVGSFWAACAIWLICSRVRAPAGTVWLLMNFGIIPFFSLLFWCDGSMRTRIRGLAGELYPYTIQKRLCPLLPDFVEASLLKIIWSHDDPKFDTRVES